MDLESSILARTHEAQKSYAFQNNKNPRVIAEYWFQNTPEGKAVFLVFYTQACRYSKCIGCNLPSKMSQHHISYKDIIAQVHYTFSEVLDEEQKLSLRKIILSNNGSILDEETFSTTALLYLLATINMECPNIDVLALETRPEYVEIEELEVLARALCEGETPTSLELAVGFEAFDEKIRNEQFNKGLSFDKFENLARLLSEINSKYQKKNGDLFRSLKLKTYFMLKPVPGLTDEDAREDIKKGIDYLDTIANRYDLGINMHLNPTYVARGTILEKEFLEGRYRPPDLKLTRDAVLYAEDKNITVYVGLYDEDLAVEGGSFLRSEEDKTWLDKLERFNATLDYSFLH